MPAEDEVSESNERKIYVKINLKSVNLITIDQKWKRGAKVEELKGAEMKEH